MTLRLTILTLLGALTLLSGCATKGGWPCWSFEKNTDQKNAAAVEQKP